MIKFEGLYLARRAINQATCACIHTPPLTCYHMRLQSKVRLFHAISSRRTFRGNHIDTVVPVPISLAISNPP